MQTIFSYIIQKRFSKVNEDVATDALAFILHSSDVARKGMMKLLREVVPDLPELYFMTQQTEGKIRPDMWGYADNEPRVYIENKFWAGLTDNQPVSYLKELAAYVQPAVLLVVAPAKREETMWRELLHRLKEAGISASERDKHSTTISFVKTGLSPILAVTSWSSVLSILEHEAANDHVVRGDLVQLRALCDAADEDAFSAVSSEQLSDQNTPTFILQLGSIVQATVELAVTENVLYLNRLMPQANWERIGRYARISGEQGAGVWLGIHFGLWKAYGGTPLWLIFLQGEFGRAQEVRPLVEPWAVREGFHTVTSNDDFAIALDIPAGEDKAAVIRSLVKDLSKIATVLRALPPSSNAVMEQE